MIWKRVFFLPRFRSTSLSSLFPLPATGTSSTHSDSDPPCSGCSIPATCLSVVTTLRVLLAVRAVLRPRLLILLSKNIHPQRHWHWKTSTWRRPCYPVTRWSGRAPVHENSHFFDQGRFRRYFCVEEFWSFLTMPPSKILYNDHDLVSYKVYAHSGVIISPAFPYTWFLFIWQDLESYEHVNTLFSRLWVYSLVDWFCPDHLSWILSWSSAAKRRQYSSPRLHLAVHNRIHKSKVHFD